MARRSRRGGRAVSRNKNQVWSTVLQDAANITTGTTLSSNIVEPSDWSVVAGAERATILRVRGWMSITHKELTGAAAGGPVFCYMAIYDEDESSLNASIPNVYADEDIMGTWGHQFPFVDAANGANSFDSIIDVKAMRKVTNGMDCRMVISNNTSATIQATLVIRALIRKGGN